MAAFDDWVVQVESFQDGRIWINNYRFDCGISNIPPELASEFESAFDGIAFEIDPADTPELIAQKVANAFYQVISQPTVRFDLKGSRVCSSGHELSRIMTIRSFLDNNLDRHRLGIPIDDRDDIELWDLMDFIVGSRYFKGTMRTGRLFFWCTKASNVDRLRGLHGDYGEELAFDVRNQLGLAHFLQGLPLVEIRIPPHLLDGKKLMAPTCIDAGLPNRVWIPTRESSGYGRALDLDTCGEGLEEVVVEELVFSPDFEIFKIGILPGRDLPIPLPETLESESKTRLSSL